MEEEELIAKLLGRRDFFSMPDIIEFVKNSGNYTDDNLKKARALKIFQTSKQQTWLVSTDKAIYCILDDNRKDKPIVRWSNPKSVILTDNTISIEIKERDYSEKSGLLSIGKRMDWLYTKKLFKGSDIKKEIKNLIKNTMLSSDFP
ncbi:MAG: hypothetical protein Q7J35_13550 [Candidatus Methanoperedens sp.]|nr:hypothetical protein [Candidatus Methanoperedens sp.]